MAEYTPGVVAKLREPPRPPFDPGLFSADAAYCGPGIYDGPPMVPASAPQADEAVARACVQRHALDTRKATAAFDDPLLIARAPAPGVRAGLALLMGSVAEAALDPLMSEGGIESVDYGAPAGAGRIIGPGDDPSQRIVSARYAGESPALLTGPLAHELLCSPVPRCDAEEKFTHGILAMVHMQLLSQTPDLATHGTELNRRVNSITLSLFNSRIPDDPRFRFIAPDGLGTIPGGRASMQTPDFWSIPFLSGHPEPVPIPEPVLAVIEALGCPVGALDSPARYTTATIRRIDDTAGTAWLDWGARARVGAALGIL